MANPATRESEKFSSLVVLLSSPVRCTAEPRTGRTSAGVCVKQGCPLSPLLFFAVH